MWQEARLRQASEDRPDPASGGITNADSRGEDARVFFSHFLAPQALLGSIRLSIPCGKSASCRFMRPWLSLPTCSIETEENFAQFLAGQPHHGRQSKADQGKGCRVEKAGHEKTGQGVQSAKAEEHGHMA